MTTLLHCLGVCSFDSLLFSNDNLLLKMICVYYVKCFFTCIPVWDNAILNLCINCKALVVSIRECGISW